MQEISIRSALDDGQPQGCGCCVADPRKRLAMKAMAGAALTVAVDRLWADDGGPRSGDWLVQVDDETKKPLSSADITLGAKPVIAWPYDPSAKALRDGTRLNRIVLVKLDPATLEAATGARAADGVVAYSGFCTHQGCDVNAWAAADKALLCFCHLSKFAPQRDAAVIAGPAPRPLPALPIKSDDGKLVIAGGFSTPPGKAA